MPPTSGHPTVYIQTEFNVSIMILKDLEWLKIIINLTRTKALRQYFLHLNSDPESSNSKVSIILSHKK